MATTEPLKFPQQQRLLFVESMVLWEGGVQRQRVCDLFGVSKGQVTRDLEDYNRLSPRNIEYDLSAKTYRAGINFKPEFASGRADEYLALLAAYAQSGSTVVIPALGAGPSAVLVPPAPAAIERAVLQRVRGAIRDGCGLQANYLDWAEEKGGKRRLWPHALVFTGARWHARAYDEHRGRFGDLALSRLSAAEPLEVPGPVPAKEDSTWHSLETVEIVPASTLSVYQQQIVAKDHGMKRQGQTWVWSAKLRRCLVPYFLARYRLEPGDDARRHARLALLHPERFRAGKLAIECDPD